MPETEAPAEPEAQAAEAPVFAALEQEPAAPAAEKTGGAGPDRRLPRSGGALWAGRLGGRARAGARRPASRRP